MNKDKLSFFGIIIATSFLSALMMGTSEVTNTFAQNNTNQANGGAPQFQPEQFRANLSGQTVVPLLEDTKATGEAEFNVNPQRDTIDYNVTVNGIDGVLAGYMHLGSPGENGPIIVYLYRADSPTGPIDGLLAKETITANELDGPMKGKTIGDLSAAMSNGNTYVTVTTAPYPNGEIRGQIITSK